MALTRIFSVEDGSKMGLQGMINYMMEECDFDTADVEDCKCHRRFWKRIPRRLARSISALENDHEDIIRFEDDKLFDGKGNHD
ncbi:MAG: hypothetical protein U5J95_01145 [Balneolaceae bacterium]|nr:hypothetical protein [Balneolaceae bacterium]